MRLAVVIPVLNEAENLDLLLPELRGALGETPYQWSILVVDDGSVDDSADVALRHGVAVLRCGRNLGKAAALQAGFDATRDADVVVTMDGDLQDDPQEVANMIRALDRSDMVSGWKRDRQDSKGRRIQSWLFTGLIRWMTKIDLHDFNCGLKAYRREVLDEIRLYGELHRLIPVLAVDEGFSVSELSVNHRERRYGRSKYTWTRAFRGPLDLVTVLFLSRFGRRPLHVFGIAGAGLALIGVAIGVYLSWIKVVQGEGIGDRPLLLLAVLLVLAGLQLFAVGLIGEMLLARTWSSSPAPYRTPSATSWRGDDNANPPEEPD